MEGGEGCDDVLPQGIEPFAARGSVISAPSTDDGSSAASSAGASDRSSSEPAALLAATAERYASYIRQKSTAGEGEGEERGDTEKGYEGGDRVRLLVGRCDVYLWVALSTRDFLLLLLLCDRVTRRCRQI